MSETHALVTLYNPSEKEFNNCRILSQQVDTVIHVTIVRNPMRPYFKMKKT